MLLWIMIKHTLLIRSVVLFVIVIPSITLTSCASLQKDDVSHTLNGVSIDSYEFLDGSVRQYLDGIFLERANGSLVTNFTTKYTGWDIFYDPENRIFNIHASSSKNSITGKIEARVHFSAAPQKYYHNTDSWDETPVVTKVGYLKGYNEVLKIDYHGRSMEQDGIVHFEYDDFSFSLSQNIISEIRTGNRDQTADYIGPTLDITLRRGDYDDLDFRISQSEVLASIYAIDFGLSCANSVNLEESFTCKAWPSKEMKLE